MLMSPTTKTLNLNKNHPNLGDLYLDDYWTNRNQFSTDQPSGSVA